jgi:predicted nuclease of predicted toxin-antitoxin system
VRFLVDENLSPKIAWLLTQAGHDSVHVYDLRAAGSADTDIVELARGDGRVIVSADTDFGAILASSRATEPSVILVREIMDLRPPDFVAVVVPQLELLEPHLKAGAIAAFSAKGIRVRPLPLR